MVVVIHVFTLIYSPHILQRNGVIGGIAAIDCITSNKSYFINFFEYYIR